MRIIGRVKETYEGQPQWEVEIDGNWAVMTAEEIVQALIDEQGNPDDATEQRERDLADTSYASDLRSLQGPDGYTI